MRGIFGYLIQTAVGVGALLGFLFVAFRPDVVTVQRGFRGVAMELNIDKDEARAKVEANQVPEPLPQMPADGPKASEVYQNVQVLGHLSIAQFTRVMTSMVQWVAPEQGCNYCHNPANMASDELYTKRVARRMVQMTQHINSKWQTHVEKTGVNCWTCHRGNNVPEYLWFEQPEGPYEHPERLGTRAGQNRAGVNVGLSSLPGDPFTPFLLEDNEIRVVGETALPTTNRRSIKQAEWTYGLMMHMSNSLGVNCTYCHNSRSVAMWSQSPTTRAKAWYGIRMVRNLNQAYLNPLQSEYPDKRLGPTGDAPKANCMTCHQGAYKPLLGAPMIEDFPSLAAPGPQVGAKTAALD